MPQGHSCGNSALIQAMGLCRQATSHYANHCWPWYLASLGHDDHIACWVGEIQKNKVKLLHHIHVITAVWFQCGWYGCSIIRNDHGIVLPWQQAISGTLWILDKPWIDHPHCTIWRFDLQNKVWPQHHEHPSIHQSSLGPTDICICELGHHWFRQWLVAW